MSDNHADFDTCVYSILDISSKKNGGGKKKDHKMTQDVVQQVI